MLILAIIPLLSVAQVEQRGVVRLKQDKYGAKVVGLEGVTISAYKANAVKSGANGDFRLVFSQKHYADSVSIKAIVKSGYELVSAHLLKKGAWNLSPVNPLEIVMVRSIDRIREQNAIERKLRNKLQADFEDSIKVLEKRLEQQSISIEKYQQQYEELSQRYENTGWVREEAEKLAKADYAGMDSIQALLTDLRKQGEGSGMINLAKRNITNKVLTQLENNPQALSQHIAEQEQRLAADRNYRTFLSEQLLNIADGFRIQMNYDSAEHYLALRAQIDNNDFVLWKDYASFLIHQCKYDKAWEVLPKFDRMTNLAPLQRSAVHRMRGDVLLRNNKYAEAEKEYGESLALLQDGTMECDLARAKVLLVLATLRMDQSDDQQAEKNIAQALSIFQKLSHGGGSDFILEKSAALRTLAMLHQNLHRFADAEREMKQCLDYCKHIPYSEVSQYMHDKVLLSLADMYNLANSYDSALVYYRKALDGFSGLLQANYDAYALDYSIAADGLAQILDSKQEADSAEHYYHIAMAMREKLASESPAIYNHFLSDIYGNIAGFLSGQKRYSEAEAFYKKALDIKRRLFEALPDVYGSTMAFALNNMGWFYLMQENTDSAEHFFSKAVSVCRTLQARNPQLYYITLARTLNNYAKFHDDMKKYSLAEKEYNEALDIYEKHRKTDKSVTPFEALLLNNLAKLCEVTAQYRRAEKLYHQSLTLFEEAESHASGVYKYYISIVYYNMANLYRLQGKWQMEYDNLLKSRELIAVLAEKSPQKYTEDLVDVLQKIVVVAEKLGKDNTEWQRQLEALSE